MADSDNENGAELRTEKRKKKKKRLHVEMSALIDTPDRIAPIVGYFSSGYSPQDSEEPPEVRLFRSKSHRSSRLDLVVKPKESSVEFVGKSYEGEAAIPQLCHYALGILDKDTQTLKVVPIAANKIFRLEPIVSSSAESLSETEEAGISSAKTQRKIADLTSIYGSKRQRTVDKKFKLLSEQKKDPSARDLASELLEADANDEVPIDTKVAAGPNIPPHNLTAMTPEKAYPLDEIIPQGERDYLFDILETLHSGVKERATFWEENHYASFTVKRIPKLKEIEDEEEKQNHAIILSYITHLVNFFRLAASTRRAKSRDNIFGDSINNYKIPRVIYQKFSSLFLDPTSNVLSSDKKELIIGYILVLTLFADNFCSDPSDIAKDLGMNLTELRLYFMQLGCKLSPESRKGRNGTLWTLPVPLKSADLTKKRRANRR